MQTAVFSKQANAYSLSKLNTHFILTLLHKSVLRTKVMAVVAMRHHNKVYHIAISQNMFITDLLPFILLHST